MSGFILYFSGREIDFPYRIALANCDTFSAKSAFLSINISQVLCHLNCSKSADVKTIGATGTGNTASFRSENGFVMVPAGNINLPVSGHLNAKFDQQLRTGIHAGSAAIAFDVVHFGQKREWIHVDRIKLANWNTVAITQTTNLTIGLASIQRRNCYAGLYTLIIAGF